MRGRAIVFSFALAGLLLAAAPSLAAARVAYVTGVVDASDPFVVPVDLAGNTAGSQISLPGGGETGAGQSRSRRTAKRAYVADAVTDQVVPIDIATNTAGTPIDVGVQGRSGSRSRPTGRAPMSPNQFDDDGQRRSTWRRTRR